jgi:hypothetical protein
MLFYEISNIYFGSHTKGVNRLSHKNARFLMRSGCFVEVWIIPEMKYICTFCSPCPESLYLVRQVSGSRQEERQAATSRDVDRD